ncbi:STAS domain-containing protein [Streptomyces sp. GTA36]
MNELGPQPVPCLSTHVVDGVTVVRLRGEIDILTATPLSVRLDVLTAGPSPELVLDLRSITFIDCSGLAALCRARNRTKIRGGRLRLVTSRPSILRLLRLTDLAHRLRGVPAPFRRSRPYSAQGRHPSRHRRMIM